MSDTYSPGGEPVDPDVRPNPYTQDIGRREDIKSFQQDYLRVVDHEDVSKHLIGEALTPPSTADVVGVGITTHPGFSPHVARADHSHDLDIAWSIYQITTKSCPVGNTFINTLSFTDGSENMLAPASTQLIQFPQKGVWQYEIRWHAQRAVAGNFTGGYTLWAFLVNGTSTRALDRHSSANATVQGRVISNTVRYNSFYFTGGGAGSANLQFRYDQSDSAAHNFTGELTVVRLSDTN